MSQPYAPPASSDQAKTPNNMVLAIIASIVSLLGCCFPWGAIALFFAMQVGKKEAAGDIPGAQDAAKKAKMIGWITIIAGVVCGILFWVFGGLAFLLALLNQR